MIPRGLAWWMVALLLIGVTGCVPSAPGATGAPAGGAGDRAPSAPAAAPAQTAAPAQAAAPAPAKPAAESARPVKVNIGTGSATLAFSPLYLAIHKGYFKELGLEVELSQLQGDVAQFAAFKSGQIDFAGPAANSAVEYRSAGQDAIVIYSMTKQHTMHALVSNRFIAAKGVDVKASFQDKVSRLKGITLGAPSLGGTTETYSRWVLKRGGLKDEDMSVVKAGFGSALVAALGSGQIDGFVQSPPAPQEAALRGDATILVRPTEIPEFSKHVLSSLITSQAYAGKNPDVVRRVVQAMDKGKQYVQQDFEGAVKELKKNFPQMNEASLRESLKFFAEAFGKDGRMDVESWQNTLELLKTAGELKGEVNPAEGYYWTNQYFQ